MGGLTIPGVIPLLIITWGLVRAPLPANVENWLPQTKGCLKQIHDTLLWVGTGVGVGRIAVLDVNAW